MNKHDLDYPLFALGFRAFFALAGLFALVLITLWTSIFDNTLVTDNYFPNSYWHAHEMLLGYSIAVIAGFLLTAVKNWTGIQTIEGTKLLGLCLLWIYGRVVPFYSELLPDPLIALIDFAFLPTLAFFVAQPIIKSGNVRNLFFIGLLLLLAIGNGLIHAEILGYSENSANLGLDMVVAIIIMMILIIAGRVFPFFTERGLKGVMSIRNPTLDIASIASSIAVFLLLILDVNGVFLAVTAVVAVIANCLRVAGWYVPRIWYVPLLWVLYLGYAWIILGFALVALAAFTIIPTTIAIHAFTVGGIGVLTLGMMARVSLGHTGRAMKASNAIAIAFVLINVAALFRVMMPALFPAWYGTFLLVSTYSWLAAFSLFVFVYIPVLGSARIDGQPG